MTAIPETSQLFPCEYVRLNAKLKDRRKFSWTHWVPNKAIDDLLGISSDEPYQTAEKYAEEKARDYLEHGIVYIPSDGAEEHITPDKIEEVSTVVEKKNLTLAEILIAEAHLRGSHSVTVSPRRRRPSLQQAVDGMDEMLNGKITLNEFFAKLQVPQSSENGANVLLKATANGYVPMAGGTPVNIRPLFHDDVLFKLVDIRRVQIVSGID